MRVEMALDRPEDERDEQPLRPSGGEERHPPEPEALLRHEHEPHDRHHAREPAGQPRGEPIREREREQCAGARHQQPEVRLGSSRQREHRIQERRQRLPRLRAPRVQIEVENLPTPHRPPPRVIAERVRKEQRRRREPEAAGEQDEPVSCPAAACALRCVPALTASAVLTPPAWSLSQRGGFDDGCPQSCVGAAVLPAHARVHDFGCVMSGGRNVLLEVWSLVLTHSTTADRVYPPGLSLSATGAGRARRLNAPPSVACTAPADSPGPTFPGLVLLGRLCQSREPTHDSSWARSRRSARSGALTCQAAAVRAGRTALAVSSAAARACGPSTVRQMRIGVRHWARGFAAWAASGAAARPVLARTARWWLRHPRKNLSHTCTRVPPSGLGLRSGEGALDREARAGAGGLLLGGGRSGG